MAKKNDWMYYALGAVGIAIVYWYVTNQKAGAAVGAGEMEAESNLATRKTGCGCSASM